MNERKMTDAERRMYNIVLGDKAEDKIGRANQKMTEIKPMSVNVKMKHVPLAKVEMLKEKYPDLDTNAFISQAVDEQATRMLENGADDEMMRKVSSFRDSDNNDERGERVIKRFGNADSLSGIRGTGQSPMKELLNIAKDRIEMLSAKELIGLSTEKANKRSDGDDEFQQTMKQLLSIKMMDMASGKGQNDSQAQALMMQMQQQQQQQAQQQMMEQFRQQQQQMQQQNERMMTMFQETMKSVAGSKHQGENDSYIAMMMKQKEFENKILQEKERRMEEKDLRMEERHARALKDIKDEISGRMEKDDFAGTIKDKLMAKITERFDPDRMLGNFDNQKESSSFSDIAKMAVPVLSSLKDDIRDVMIAKSQQPQINVQNMQEAQKVSTKINQKRAEEEAHSEREELYRDLDGDGSDDNSDIPAFGTGASFMDKADDGYI